jgi:hypothetical protein
VSEPKALHAGFLGTWILDPKSCQYDQGEAPAASRYHIEERAGRLYFSIEWTDTEGVDHRVEFSGVPDGSPEPFAGGELADALSVTAVSDTELTSSAFWRGEELMVAQRQLDPSGTAMRVIQLVRLPDGTRPTNIGVYHKQLRN